MVRRQQQRPKARRTVRTNITSRRINRAVRVARNAPLARVRARPTIRGQSLSAASINGFRRMTAFPKKLPTDKNNTSKWWLETLKWIGITTMKILLTAVSSEAVNEHLLHYPLPLEHPLRGKPLDGAVPTGCITILAFDYGAFLGESDFVKQLDDGKSFGICHYRQARLEWVKITIHPTSHPDNRGGMIAAAITPVSQKEFQDDFAVKENEAHDFLELLKTPGIVYKSATTPTMLTYSPKPSDYAYNWGCFGVNSASKTPLQALCYLHIGLTNLASDKAISSEYTLTHSLLDLSVEARVHLREYDEEVYCPFNPVPIVNVDKATETSFRRKLSIPLDRYFNHHGIYLRETDLSHMEMSP